MLRTRLTLLGTVLLCAVAVQPITQAQETPPPPAASAKAPAMTHAAKLADKVMVESLAYLRAVKDKESADSAALRFVVDKGIIMGIGEYFDAVGATDDLMAPEMTENARALHELEEDLYENKYYGSTLLAHAWDAYGEDLPKPTEEEKAAAIKKLDELDAKKIEDILASVKDRETADAAARAFAEKLAVHYLLTDAGYAPKERQCIKMSDSELRRFEELGRAAFYDSLLMSIIARELMFSHIQAAKSEPIPEVPQVLPPVE